jgi:hypothetical protein
MDVSAILPKDNPQTNESGTNIISVNLDEEDVLSGRGSSS